MSDSSRPQSDSQEYLATPDDTYRDVNLRLEARKRMVTQITEYARYKRLDATEEIVSRHYRWFFRWYTGGIATGYLMGRTGVEKMAPNIDHWSK
jgi:hypothetical protein